MRAPQLETDKAQAKQLRRVESRLLEVLGPSTTLRAAVRHAAEHAATVARAGLLVLPAVVLSADCLAALAAERGVTLDDLEAVVGAIHEETGLAPEAIRLSIYLRLCRDPRLLGLPPDDALELQVVLLAFAAELSHASLWTAGHASGYRMHRRVRRAAGERAGARRRAGDPA